MIHDPALLSTLETFERVAYSANVFRATRTGLDPLAPSTAGGRWSLKDDVATLYISCSREGALAEIAYYLCQWSPLPTKAMVMHTLRVGTQATLRLLQGDFAKVGIIAADYLKPNNPVTQRIGAAVAFLGCDGLLAPSARWNVDNLMLFETDGRSIQDLAELVSSEPADWLAFARKHGLVAKA